MPPLVSILIPAYNAQETIADSLRSAIGQTWKNREIIVVDDGSTDRTPEVVSQFARQGVRLVTQPNSGAATARNHAYSLAGGDYIQWLDADDLLGTEKIARQMAVAFGCPSRLTLYSGPWGSFAYRPQKAKFVTTSLWRDLTPAQFLLRKMEGNVYMTNASWLVSRELSELAGPWNTQVRHDDDGVYFCEVLHAADGIRFVPEARMFYRRTASSSQSNLAGGLSNRKLESMHRSLQMHIETLRWLDDSPRAKAACIKFLQSYLFAFYPARPDLVSTQAKWAEELGGQLVLTPLRPKYAWLEPLFGYGFAKRAELLLPRLKHQLGSSIDKALYELQGEKPLPI